MLKFKIDIRVESMIQNARGSSLLTLDNYVRGVTINMRIIRNGKSFLHERTKCPLSTHDLDSIEFSLANGCTISEKKAHFVHHEPRLLYLDHNASTNIIYSVEYVPKKCSMQLKE